MTASPHIRHANKCDLPFINVVIKAAVMTWPISTRAKRLSAGVLAYDAVDLVHFEMFVYVRDEQVVGVAAWDPHGETPVFHGLYVTPEQQRRGVGSALMNTVFDRATAQGKPGVLIKSARASVSYFEALSFERIQKTADTDYPYTF